VLVLLACFGLAACGESKEDKAMSSVCDARADISKQVDHLKSLTIGTATVDDVQNSLKAIGDDLSKIKDAQGDLSGSRKQQVQDANAKFSSQIKEIGSTVGRSLSLSSAKTQLQSALSQLADAYKTTLGPIDCS
jgi:Rad3-related DNA helicase